MRRGTYMKLGSRVVVAKRIGALAIILGLSGAALAGPGAPGAFGAPTLDELGLIGLGVVVGIAGVVAFFRRKK
jgi:hypothetical protein